MLFQKLNEAEVKKAWDRYMESNDRWKLKEAQHQAKAEIKVCTHKHAHHIAFFKFDLYWLYNCDTCRMTFWSVSRRKKMSVILLKVQFQTVTCLDEKEKNMVSVALLNISIYKFKIDIICSWLFCHCSELRLSERRISLLLEILIQSFVKSRVRCFALTKILLPLLERRMS